MFLQPVEILVGGLEHELYFPKKNGMMIQSSDELIFFRRVGIPPISFYYSY